MVLEVVRAYNKAELWSQILGVLGKLTYLSKPNTDSITRTEGTNSYKNKTFSRVVNKSSFSIETIFIINSIKIREDLCKKRGRQGAPE